MVVDMERAETLVENFRQREAGLVELLLDIQDEFNFVPEKVLVLASEELSIPLERLLGAATGETTDDGALSLENVHCLGACALGPIVMVNDEYHGHMTTKKTSELIGKVKAKAAEEEVEAVA